MRASASTGILIGLISVLVGGCASQPVAWKLPAPKDAAPAVTSQDIARLATLPDPEVVHVTPGKRGNGPIYNVLGKRYQVMESAKGFKQEGRASWYGKKFHGRQTSSGEPFDMYQLTAAHKHLPLPSYVKVTNLNNGKQTIVKVNDRGPFHGGRVIDLSFGAAVKLGFHNSGTAPVRIEVVEPAPQVQKYMVQVGAYSQLASADVNKARVKSLTGLNSVVLKTSKDQLYRVRVGPVRAGAELERVQSLLQTADYHQSQLIPLPGS
jgi:rare lipoprotein A